MSLRARFLVAALSCAAVVSGVVPHGLAHLAAEQQPAPAPAGPVFEVRAYIASAGKLDDLQARFRDHTIRIFARHGMKSIAYWIPTDQGNTLVYIIQHESREAAARNWKAFQSDPEWVKVAAASNVTGNIVARVDSYFATAADYSPIK
jgi:hypothetical protein